MRVDPKRSKIMSAIKAKNTKPELIIRKALHSRGYRFRIHSNNFPGHPDIVLPKYKSIILVNGCFWHKHDCHIFNPKRKLSSAWASKIDGNVARDKRNINAYINAGWKVFIVWECSIQGKTKQPLDVVINVIINWLEGDEPGVSEISGLSN